MKRLIILTTVLFYGFLVYSQGQLVDKRDGNKYPTLKLGDLTWMGENLRYNTEGSWVYDDNEENGLKYGRLYNYHMALDACPDGWRLPSDQDWMSLETALDMPADELELMERYRGKWNYVGFVIKSEVWVNTANPEFQMTAFNAPPAGYYHRRITRSGKEKNNYIEEYISAMYWTSTGMDSESDGDAIIRFLSTIYPDSGGIFRGVSYKDKGASVRCVK